MKAVKSAHFNDEQYTGESPRRGTKLTPNKKSGKERHNLYRSLEEDDDDDVDNYFTYSRESTLDYIDDGDEIDDDDEN